jgi:hypothetical protein
VRERNATREVVSMQDESRGSLVTAAQAAAVVNRSVEGVRQAIRTHGLEEDYRAGKRRFRVDLDDMIALYKRIGR